MRIFLVVLMGMALTGCVTTTVIKEIQVKKNADGKVIETTEIERTIQQGGTKGMQFDYLKNKEGDKTPAAIYY